MSSIIWAGVAEKLLGVLEKFLDPQQYKIVRMKRLQKALNVAEEEFSLGEDMVLWMELKVPASKDVAKFRKKHDSLHKKFCKYD